jgi:Domain of unknown function (DUF4150)/GHH signature containing HNH/Endo VII superfamily nuclease toxin  2
MANEVYANGNEIACKAAAGKTVAATPDTCLSPPSPPAGPVPIPYPNTSYASDTTKGTTTVMISGQEVMMKDQSTFKKSTGDEAATKSLGMGVVTHCIQGEASFVAWSMDVLFEGANVDRHLDLTLHNEQCTPANTPTWPYLDAASIASTKCADNARTINDECPNAGNAGEAHKDCPPYGGGTTAVEFAEDPCLQAKRCMLVPYDRSAQNGGCCPGQTPHHLVPKHHFAGISGYDENAAPCVCVEGHSWHRNEASQFEDCDKTHAEMHDLQDAGERYAISIIEGMIGKGQDVEGRTPDHALSYGEIKQNSLTSHATVFKDSKCDQECMAAQLDAYHKQSSVNVGENQFLHTKKVGAQFEPDDL